jgi:hypothetical protein
VRVGGDAQPRRRDLRLRGKTSKASRREDEKASSRGRRQRQRRLCVKRFQTAADPCAAGRMLAASLTHSPGRACSDRSRRRAQRATTDDDAGAFRWPRCPPTGASPARLRAPRRRRSAEALCRQHDIRQVLPGAVDQTPSSRFPEGYSQAKATGSPMRHDAMRPARRRALTDDYTGDGPTKGAGASWVRSEASRRHPE